MAFQSSAPTDMIPSLTQSFFQLYPNSQEKGNPQAKELAPLGQAVL